MHLLRIFIKSVALLMIYQTAVQSIAHSTCPYVYLYKNTIEEPNRIDGVAVLLAESDLDGIWLQLIFDRPSIQLNNWFAEVTTSDNMNYLIRNQSFYLKANTPQIVPFFMKSYPNEPRPRLKSFNLNGRTICSQKIINDASHVTTKNSNGTFRNNGEVVVNRLVLNEDTFSSQNERRVGSTKNQETTSSSKDVSQSGQHKQQQNQHQQQHRQQQQIPKYNSALTSICGTVVRRSSYVDDQTNSEGKYPWHAQLYAVKDNTLRYICGASLVSKYHIVTAAHCITERKSKNIVSTKNLLIYLGKPYLKQYSNVGLQTKSVSEIIRHPQYNQDTFRNNVAVIKFAEPINITDYVRPICLWQSSIDLSSIYGEQGSAIGWDYFIVGEAVGQLIEKKMTVVSHETCIYSLPDFYSRFSSDKSYCAGFKNESSICNGDAGGGMVFPLPTSSRQNPRWQLRGIASVKVLLQSDSKCDSSHYVVFTDASKYIDWIAELIY